MNTRRADQLIRRALVENDEQPSENPGTYYFGMISPEGVNHARQRDFSLLFRRTEGDPATHTAIARHHGFKNDHHAVGEGWVRWHEDTHLKDRGDRNSDPKKRAKYNELSNTYGIPADRKLHTVEFNHNDPRAVEQAFLHVARHVPEGHTQVHVRGVLTRKNYEGAFQRGEAVHLPGAFHSGVNTRAGALRELASLHSHLHNREFDPDYDSYDDYDGSDPSYVNLFDKHLGGRPL